MSFKKNDVITVISVAGEFVGKLIKKDEHTLILGDPKMLVDGEQGLGFANGICITGDENPSTMTFYLGSVVFITETNERVAATYRKAISGLILPDDKMVL